MKRENKIQYQNLYEKHLPEMYAYGMAFGIDKETVLDAIHDVFLHIIERETEIENQPCPKFYLLNSLKNRLFSIKRKEIFLENIDDAQYHDFAIVVSGLEDLIEEEERNSLISQIEAMLKELTSRQREIIYLRYMQNLSYEQIAALLQITLKAARKLTYRALERIRHSRNQL